MTRRFLAAMAVLMMALVPIHYCAARGFGGGGFHGGGGFGGGGGFRGGMGGGGIGGGGFGGGARPGGFGGGGFGGGGVGGGGFDRGGMGGLGGGGLGGGFDRGGFGGGELGRGGFGEAGLGNFDRGGDGFGNFAGRGPGGEGVGGGGLGGGPRDSFGDQFGGATPSRGQLNNFLGLPSDEGLHNLGGNFDVNRGTYAGSRGGMAAGTSITGPQGNTVYRGGAVGPEGGAIAGRGFEGAGGAAGGQAIARGPEGRVAGGGAIRGPDGGAAARGFVAGPAGAAAGFTRVTPSGRYTAAAAVRTNYNHWGVYGRGWYADHPGAWAAAGWAAGAAWNACTWDSAAAWCGYDAAPMYYDYGNDITYQNNNVYVGGQDVGTSEQYYDQAASLASTGTSADAPADGDWLPLGVFALTKTGETKSDVSIQLAVNKQGVIRGNYTDTATGKTQLVHGSVDKSTQRVAFTVGDNKTTVIETGLYNLTKDESPALLHFGKDRTEQWLLVRLKQPDAANQDSP